MQSIELCPLYEGRHWTKCFFLFHAKKSIMWLKEFEFHQPISVMWLKIFEFELYSSVMDEAYWSLPKTAQKPRDRTMDCYATLLGAKDLLAQSWRLSRGVEGSQLDNVSQRSKGLACLLLVNILLSANIRIQRIRYKQDLYN